MLAPNANLQTPPAMKWTGRVLSTLIVLPMALGGVMNLARTQMVIEGTTKMGYPLSSIVPIGLAALVSAILYAVPRTAVLGAILLTGYFGGAVATHVRAGENNWFIAVLFGVVTWLGLYLRDARLRELLPIRQPQTQE